ncbi:MAG: hypothetical protein QW815_00415 [Nitrososphaerota archaeon]
MSTREKVRVVWFPFIVPRFYLILSVVIDHFYSQSINFFLPFFIATTIYDALNFYSAIGRNKTHWLSSETFLSQLHTFSLTHVLTSLIFLSHLLVSPLKWSYIVYIFYLVLIPTTYSTKTMLLPSGETTPTPTVSDYLISPIILTITFVSFVLHPGLIVITLILLALSFIHLFVLTNPK